MGIKVYSLGSHQQKYTQPIPKGIVLCPGDELLLTRETLLQAVLAHRYRDCALCRFSHYDERCPWDVLEEEFPNFEEVV